jgi:sulfopyruvate decarboxylase TPP-binding subunit
MARKKKQDTIYDKDPKDMGYEDIQLLLRAQMQGWLKEDPEAQVKVQKQMLKILESPHVEDKDKIKAGKVLQDYMKITLDIAKVHEPKEEVASDTNIEISFFDACEQADRDLRGSDED